MCAFLCSSWITRGVLCVFVGFTFFLTFGRSHAEDKKNQDEVEKNLLELRISLATKIHKMAVEAYLAGQKNATIDQVHQAKAKTLAARLDACKDEKARIELYRDSLNDAISWEATVERRVRNGAPEIEALQARLHRLEMEILVVRSKK